MGVSSQVFSHMIHAISRYMHLAGLPHPVTPPFLAVPQDEKARLQAALSSLQQGGSASEAKISELQDTIDSLRYACA